MEVVIIGLGSIAAKHIFALRQLYPEVNISAFRSYKEAEVTEGIHNIHDFNEILSPEFVIISNPTNLHYSTIKRLVDLKIPMLIEKPPLHTLTNIDDLINVIKRNNIFTYVACNLRFHPCLQFLKDFIDQQNPVINEVNVYCGSYLPEWRPDRDFRTIYSAVPEMGGGVHLDLFHEIDYTLWIFGQPLKSYNIKKNKSSLNIEAYDYANYILEYQSYTASIILNYYRPSTKRQIEVLFENDIWTVDLVSNKITDVNGLIKYQANDFTIMNTYISQMEYFLHVLRNNTNIMNSLPESLQTLKIVLANEI